MGSMPSIEKKKKTERNREETEQKRFPSMVNVTKVGYSLAFAVQHKEAKIRKEKMWVVEECVKDI